MKAITISTLKKALDKYFDEVSKHQEALAVRGKTEDDTVVIMSLSEYNSFKETEHLLSTASNRQRLELSLEQWKQVRAAFLNCESRDWKSS